MVRSEANDNWLDYLGEEYYFAEGMWARNPITCTPELGVTKLRKSQHIVTTTTVYFFTFNFKTCQYAVRIDTSLMMRNVRSLAALSAPVEPVPKAVFTASSCYQISRSSMSTARDISAMPTKRIVWRTLYRIPASPTPPDSYSEGAHQNDRGEHHKLGRGSMHSLATCIYSFFIKSLIQGLLLKHLLSV
jgi:hypothetical protein